MMLARAWRNGVPVYSLDQLENSSDAGIVAISALFKMDSKVSDLVYGYWSKVKALSATVVPVSVSDDVLFDALKKSDRVSDTACYVAKLPEPMKSVPHDITGLLPGHMALFIAWLKHEVANHKAGVSISQENQRKFRLLNNEISRMAKRAKYNSFSPERLTKTEQEMWNIWESSNPATLGNLAALFSSHVHDSMKTSMIEEIWGDFFYSRHYLHYRPITTIEIEPEIEPEQSFFEKVREKVVEYSKEKVQEKAGEYSKTGKKWVSNGVANGVGLSK